MNVVRVVQIVESASSNSRHKYNEFIETAKTAKIKNIIFYSMDRESRNLSDSEKNEGLIRNNIFVIHYALDRKAFGKDTPDSEFLSRDLNGAINKNYSRELSTKVKNGTRTKAASGWSPVCKPALGYINQKLKTDQGFDRRRGTIIVPDPNIQNIKWVQREFELRTKTPMPSLQEIRKIVLAENLVPFDKIKTYHTSAVGNHLKNIFYDGRYIWSGVEYKGLHERIISKDIFWRVQETFGHRNPYGKKTKGIFRNGWIKCANEDCQCNVIYDPRIKHIKSTGQPKTYHHYRCTNGRGVHANTIGMRVTEQNLLSQFEAAVDQITITDSFKVILLEAINKTVLASRALAKKDLENMTAMIESLEKKEDGLYTDLKSQIIDDEAYKRMIKNVRLEKDLCTQQIHAAQIKISDEKNETASSILQLATDAKSLWKRRTPVEQVLMLEKLLSNQVLDGSSVRYTIIKPLQILSEMKQNQEWRRERDLNPR